MASAPSPGAADGPLAWVYRIRDDEQSTLIRAAANYALRGHDPELKKRADAEAAAAASAPEAAAAAAVERKLGAKRRVGGALKCV